MVNSEEEFHELMDNLEEIIKPEIHEKCMHASGTQDPIVLPDQLIVVGRVSSRQLP